jgi:hypothetical protein
MSDGSSTHNYINTGQTQVGVQGGDVRGDVHFGGPPAGGGPAPGLRQQIEELCTALIAAREAGHIDDATLAEASAALDEAREHAGATDEAGRGALIRALRRTKGLVEEVGGLVAAIAAVIATVAGIK